MKNNNKYLVWTALIVLVTVMLLMFQGCNFMKKRYPKTIKKELVLNSANYQKLIVNNPNGNVNIRKSDNDSVIIIKAEITKNLTKKELDKPVEDVMFNIDTTGKTIFLSDDNVKHERGFRFQFEFGSKGETDYTILVPLGIDIEIEGTNGKVDLRDFNNNVTTDLTNGSIKVKNIYGNLKLALTNGSISAELDSTKGIEFETTNGSVRLDVGNDFSGVFDLRTRNGKISYNDLEFSNVTKSSNEFKGTLKDDDKNIRIETTNGRITIDKK